MYSALVALLVGVVLLVLGIDLGQMLPRVTTNDVVDSASVEFKPLSQFSEKPSAAILASPQLAKQQNVFLTKFGVPMPLATWPFFWMSVQWVVVATLKRLGMGTAAVAIAARKTLRVCAASMAIATRQCLRLSTCPVIIASWRQFRVHLHPMTALLCHVGHIACMIGDEEMIRAHTPWVVAGVANKEPIGNITVSQHVRHAMGVDPTLATQPKRTVSSSRPRAFPRETGGIRTIYLRLEPPKLRCGKLAVHRGASLSRGVMPSAVLSSAGAL
jgi:hypothetical protein